MSMEVKVLDIFTHWNCADTKPSLYLFCQLGFTHQYVTRLLTPGRLIICSFMKDGPNPQGVVPNFPRVHRCSGPALEGLQYNAGARSSVGDTVSWLFIILIVPLVI